MPRFFALPILALAVWLPSEALGQVLAVPAIVPAEAGPVAEAKPQSTAPPQAAAPSFPKPPTRTLRQLQQADALAEDKNWDELIDLLEEVSQNSSEAIVELAPGSFGPLSVACQRRLLELPADGLAAYRARVDDLAKQWLDEGRRTGDAALLTRIATELAASRWSDDALWTLGELALAEGDPAAARRAWQRIHPTLTGPTGRALADDLARVDLVKHAARVSQVLRTAQRPPDGLYCRDADVPLGQVLAGLVVASVREGDLPRAKRELAALKLLEPQATGALGGRDTALAPALAELLAAAKDWPAPAQEPNWATPAANVRRTGAGAPVDRILAPMWPENVRVPGTNPGAPIPPQLRIAGLQQLPKDNMEARTVSPLISGRWFVYRMGKFLRALDLVTGRAAITDDGILLEELPPPGGLKINGQLIIRGNIQIINNGMMVNSALGASASDILTLHHDVLYTTEPAAPVGPSDGGAVFTPRTSAPRRLVGLDLRRDALRVVELAPPEGAAFSGPPLVVGGRLYVALRTAQLRPTVALACYSANTGKQLWKTSICTGQPAANEQSTPPDVLTLSGSAIYFNTNLGAVVAVASDSGRVLWMRTYDRTAPPASPTPNIWGGFTVANNQPTTPPAAAPCIASVGQILVQPTDGQQVLSLDAATGAVRWRAPRAGAATVLGVTAGVLVVGGERLTAYDITSGAVRFRWPLGAHASLRGAGQGCLAGEEVFWPTRDAVYALNVRTGEPSRAPIDISELTSDGANLIAAYGCLVVAGTKEMNVWGPYQIK